MIKVKLINKSKNPEPGYKTIGSAGMDLQAFLNEDVVLEPMERKIIPTGLYIELPDGYEAQVRPRSGMAIKEGITVLNTPGTIDSDYRGEIGVILINLSNIPVKIKNGDRVAQMIISKYEKVMFINSENLEQTERGEGGFGHTGKN